MEISDLRAEVYKELSEINSRLGRIEGRLFGTDFPAAATLGTGWYERRQALKDARACVAVPNDNCRLSASMETARIIMS